MLQAVRQNFEEKVSYLARSVPGMTITEDSSFLAVDCGLPSDTFNVLVVRDTSAPAVLLATVDHFHTKGFPLAAWYWASDVKDTDRSLFLQHGLTQTETHVAMYANLSEKLPFSPSVEGLEIKHITTANELRHYGEVLAALFGDSSEGRQVAAYYQRLSEYSPSAFPAMRHYLGTLRGAIVASGMLFIGSETAGIYDVATRDDYRGKGIGSALFHHLLQEARAWNHRFCVLQASPDGLGIYMKAGFRAIADVHTFENRGSLSPAL